MVPFVGNEMQTYPPSVRRGGEWRLLLPFDASLTLVGTSRGMSARTFHWRDEATGITYPMFPSDLVDVIQRTTVTRGVASARWVARKKGANYGIGPARVQP